MSPNPNLDVMREFVRNEITPHLPTSWDVKPGIVTPGTLSKTTVFLEYSRIEPLPEAPIGNARCTFDLTVASPLTDPAKGEDEVDPAVVDLILALDGHKQIIWTGAEKKVIEETYLAWTVTLYCYAKTAKTEE